MFASVFNRNNAKIAILAATAATLSLSSCAKKNDDDDNNKLPSQIVEVSGEITTNTTWTADKVYRLNGFVRVGEDKTKDGQPTKKATLTIEPGTIIIGDRETKGTLIVQRGSKIIANGTPEKPIVMTSERPAGLRESGDWGGLVICGMAKNNLPGGVGELEGQYGAFHGGNNDDDNSGSLKYVRIEFAGIPINPNQEVNSLTLGSVGRGTVIENVMCSFGLDDAFEWFGGTVNCKNLIAYSGLDDDLDVDNGFSGNVQFALCIRDKARADISGSNGFEVDNDGAGTPANPFTSATFSNITIIGPKATGTTEIDQRFGSAAHLRRNNKLKIHNTVMTGYPIGALIDGGSTSQNALNGDLVLKNVYLAGVKGFGSNGYGDGTPTAPRAALVSRSAVDGFNVQEWFLKSANKNRLFGTYEEAGISLNIFDGNFSNGKPVVLPASGSPLLSGADFTGLRGFQTVSFIGAFGTSDWTAGWAEWKPQNKVYYQE
jgi:hypothetical protein